MISCKKIIIVIIIIIALVIVLFGQENYETEKIMENHFSACGGSAPADIRAKTMTGSVSRGITEKVLFETSAKAPGKKSHHQTFAWGDRAFCGFDGAANESRVHGFFTVNTPSLLQAVCLLH